jgi:hypothetical protein
MTPEKLKQSVELQKKLDFFNQKIEFFNKRLNFTNTLGWESKCTQVKFTFSTYDDTTGLRCDEINTGSEIFLVLFNILLNRLIIERNEVQKLFDSL